MGGLGNQLFQIFTTFAYAIRSYRKMILPYSETLTVGIHRPTYWDTLLCAFKPFTTIHPNSLYDNNAVYQFAKYNENGFRYCEIAQFGNKEIMLNGYFQSFLYFEKEYESILKMIKLEAQQNSIRTEYPELFAENSHVISMHFRLGDYKLNPEYHPIMPFQYYKNALKNITERRNDTTKQVNVLYFCEKEDNDHVNQIICQLQTDFPTVVFKKVDDGIVDWKQLLVMSCCNDNIIANSSFSWWAGHFNRTSDKIVCYPSVWFGKKSSHDVSDLFPTNWTQISW
jgi:hypothetical protein